MNLQQQLEEHITQFRLKAYQYTIALRAFVKTSEELESFLKFYLKLTEETMPQEFQVMVQAMIDSLKSNQQIYQESGNEKLIAHIETYSSK